MFRANGGVIEPGRDRMGQFDLAFFVREQKRFCALENSEPSGLKTRRMFATANSSSAGFDPDHSHVSILQKRMKQTDSITAASHAGDEQIWKAFFALENLAARLNADDALKIAHHHGIGMRAENRA